MKYINRLTAIALCGAVVLAVPACTGGGSSSRGTHSPGKTRTSAAAEQPQTARLVLSAGRSSAQYHITAPSPANYSFDVTVTAPMSADISVNISTWYGAILSILDSTRDKEACSRLGAEDICSERFPFLPAQRAGTWTVIASKQSGPAATVHATVTFLKPY
jgi:hypothetical protein